jgi:uncharacterized repeat protein (TIGR03803 family)
LYAFTGGTDGYGPLSNLIHDAAGNLYGTAAYGGITTSCLVDEFSGCGIVFEVSRKGQETVLYRFTGGADGWGPGYGLARDAEGNLYGTTGVGGELGSCYGGFGCGVVFRLDTAGSETVLYTFSGGSDGGRPNSAPTRDTAGNFYGTTLYGGQDSCGGGLGCGIIFQVSSAGVETVLHTFTGPDGENPVGGVFLSPSTGNLYGLATGGGAHGLGSVYGITAGGKQILVQSFSGTDGANPIDSGGLLWYKGALYGTTPFGGPSPGEGVAFKVGP